MPLHFRIPGINFGFLTQNDFTGLSLLNPHNCHQIARLDDNTENLPGRDPLPHFQTEFSYHAGGPGSDVHRFEPPGLKLVQLSEPIYLALFGGQPSIDSLCSHPERALFDF